THPLGEADRIITLLTRRHGKVRAVAKGVRRTGSRFGARLEPFTLVDVQLHAGRSLHTVTQVVTIEAFAVGISADYGRLTAARETRPHTGPPRPGASAPRPRRTPRTPRPRACGAAAARRRAPPPPRAPVPCAPPAPPAPITARPVTPTRTITAWAWPTPSPG